MTSTRLTHSATRTVWREATAISAALIAAGIGLGFADILPLSALAFLGGLSSAVAAVRERPGRPFGWLLVSLGAIALTAVSVASFLARP